MSHVLTGIGMLAATVMIGASATMNFLFMHSLGRTELEGNVFGSVSVAVDVLKALLAIFVAVAARKGDRTYVLIAGGAFILFSTASILSAIGFSVQNRTGIADAATVKTSNLAGAETELNRLGDKLRALPSPRPFAMIEAEIKRRQFDARWKASHGCATASGQQQLAYCQSLAELAEEMAAAREAAKLEDQIAGQRERIAVLRSELQHASGDRQTGLLARVFMLDANTLRVSLAAFIALIVEVASGLGLYLATGHMASPRTTAAEEHEAKSDTLNSPAVPSVDPAPSPTPTIAVRGRTQIAAELSAGAHPRTTRSMRATPSNNDKGAGV